MPNAWSFLIFLTIQGRNNPYNYKTYIYVSNYYYEYSDFALLYNYYSSVFENWYNYNCISDSVIIY